MPETEQAGQTEEISQKGCACVEAIEVQQQMLPETNVTTEEIEIGGSPAYFFVKRLLDILLSIIAAVILMIPMLLIALLVKLDSEGPVLYTQERLGLNGKPFMIYKFRTMIVDAEAGGPRWAAVNDQRCTRLGAVLRKSRLDELPQLINILKGEMSLVGPRPERAYFYNIFETYIPGFRNRMVVKPGLTGLAQVNGGYSLLPEEKLVYDMEYVRTQSLPLDILCMLKTARLVITHKGAR